MERFHTRLDKPVFIKRATLADYVIHMRRGATILFPKDAWTIIGLMDIGPGSVVLEAGTGSGSLTLHLSRHGK